MSKSDWKGYLLKSVPTGETFPQELIAAESYNAKCNQVEYITAKREDDSRDMILKAASGRKSQFTFKTIDGMGLEDLDAVEDWISGACVDSTNMKYKFQFWVQKTRKYQTGIFYLTEPEYPIITISDDDVECGEMEYKFTEC